jgi:fumarylpyruvate hydrolase
MQESRAVKGAPASGLLVGELIQLEVPIIMSFAFPPAPVIAIPAMSSKPFPVRHIYCVGRNHLGGATEVEGNLSSVEPLFFMKPALSILPNNAVMPYPPCTADLHAEVGLVVALNLGGRDIPEQQANDFVFGYAVGLDMTRHDLQTAAKDQGLPWDMSKSFDCSTPISAITPEFYAGIIAKGKIELKVNGAVRQSGDVGEMIWAVPKIIGTLSKLVELHPGDLIFTGTPKGAGSVVKGDQLEATVAGLEPLLITIR